MTTARESEAIADWLLRMVASARGGSQDMAPADCFLEMAARGASSVDEIMRQYNKKPCESTGDDALARLVAQQTVCQVELVGVGGELLKALEALTAAVLRGKQ